MKTKTLFLKFALGCISFIVLFFCIQVFPYVPHRINQIYPEATYEPYSVIFGIYLSAILFYFVVFQAYQLLRLIDHNNSFSEHALKTMIQIKRATFGMFIAYCFFFPYFYLMADVEDAPGIIFVGTFIVLIPLVISVFASILAKLLDNAIQIQNENDLTV